MTTSIPPCFLSDSPGLPVIAPATVPLPPVPQSTAVAPVVPPETVPVWGLPFVRLNTGETVDWIEQLINARTPTYVITANLNWVMLSHQRGELAAVNREAGGLVADGMPIVWRSQWSYRYDALPERVAGSELVYRLAERAAATGKSIYLTGGAPGVAETAAQRLQALYPGLRIAGADSPPFRALSEDEQTEHLRKIRASKADMLWVAFGQPKGELWIHRHYRETQVPVSIQLGASFDFIAGVAQRAPLGWQKLGLEWAYRMFSDPKRLAPRYAANASFLLKQLARDAWGTLS